MKKALHSKKECKALEINTTEQASLSALVLAPVLQSAQVLLSAQQPFHTHMFCKLPYQ